MTAQSQKVTEADESVKRQRELALSIMRWLLDDEDRPADYAEIGELASLVLTFHERSQNSD